MRERKIGWYLATIIEYYKYTYNTKYYKYIVPKIDS